MKRFFASGSFFNSHKDKDLHNKENKLYMRAGKIASELVFFAIYTGSASGIEERFIEEFNAKE